MSVSVATCYLFSLMFLEETQKHFSLLYLIWVTYKVTLLPMSSILNIIGRYFSLYLTPTNTPLN